jgi:hypothetical protein
MHHPLAFLIWENLGNKSQESVVQFLLFSPEMRSSEATYPNLDNFLVKKNNFNIE